LKSVASTYKRIRPGRDLLSFSASKLVSQTGPETLVRRWTRRWRAFFRCLATVPIKRSIAKPRPIARRPFSRRDPCRRDSSRLYRGGRCGERVRGWWERHVETRDVLYRDFDGAAREEMRNLVLRFQ
jgi:hypothetical protein